MNIETFFKISYGLYIVTSKDGEKINGHISNTVFQVTAKPSKIAVCTHKDNLTTHYIEKNKVFAVSILQQDVNLEFIGPFGFRSGKDMDKFTGIEYKTGKTGCPLITEKTVGFIECEVEQSLDVGTHILYIGRVIEADLFNDKLPLTYAYYRDVIKGYSPENSPTYNEKEEKEKQQLLAEKLKSEKQPEEKEVKTYICSVCGYEYKPEEGDPTFGVPAGTTFGDLPDDWICPICGAGKEEFHSE